MVLEDPGMWCPKGNAKGLGDLVGLIGGIGLGLGVLANGLRGIWPTDFLLDGDCNVFVLTPNLCLCFKPCNEDGLVVVEAVKEEAGKKNDLLRFHVKNISVVIAWLCVKLNFTEKITLLLPVVTGEHGAESAGLEESDWGSGVLVECLILVITPGEFAEAPPAPILPVLISDLKLFKLWLPESIWFISAVAFREESFRNNDVFRRLSSRRLLDRGLAATDRLLKEEI